MAGRKVKARPLTSRECPPGNAEPQLGEYFFPKKREVVEEELSRECK
jgi:hypothetical protein